MEGGAWWAGGHVIADRELPRLPLRRVGRRAASRALQQARRLGAEIVVTRSIARIDASTREIHLDGGDVLSARTIILACGVSWRRLEIEGFDGLAGKGISYGAARSEAANTHGLDIHIIGAGNSAGQAAMFFSSHARTVTILHRGETLEKSMSRYFGEPARDPVEHPCALPHGGRVQARRRLSRGARRRRQRDGREGPPRVRRVLFIFIGADAETGWLPPEIALDPKGYVLTGSEVRAAARWDSTATRTCSRRAFQASSRLR